MQYNDYVDSIAHMQYRSVKDKISVVKLVANIDAYYFYKKYHLKLLFSTSFQVTIFVL